MVEYLSTRGGDERLTFEEVRPFRDTCFGSSTSADETL